MLEYMLRPMIMFPRKILKFNKIKIVVRQNFEISFVHKVRLTDIQTNLHYKLREISLEIQNFIVDFFFAFLRQKR